MYEEDGELRKLSNPEKIIFFAAGLLLNAFGNGLTVATNMGSAPWTAAAANLAHATHLPIDRFLFLFGLISAFLVVIILRRFDVRRFFGNIVFAIAFSFIIGFTARFFMSLGVPHFPTSTRTILDILGITLIASGISLTQRLQIFLHPSDDLTTVMRFKFFHGNVVMAQTMNFVVPMCISLTVWLITKELVAINIGTVFAFLCQGIIISRADRHLFPGLVHKDK